jgi:DNA sulfur modification protein DndC
MNNCNSNQNDHKLDNKDKRIYSYIRNTKDVHNMNSMTSSEIKEKEENVYKIFDAIVNKNKLTLAYSGGKDSTILAILLLRWLRLRKVKGLKITLLHNDTLSEINPMELWAREFMYKFKQEAESLGNEVNINIVKPSIVDSFYWRVFIRGYPAPSFSFRWCVELLKIRPTSKIDNGNLFLVGLRENESTARVSLVRKKYGSCSEGAGKCLAYYFATYTKNKIAPLRDWSNVDVWEFLRNVNDVDISPLLYLYGCEEARYGCWHCTLTKVQWGLHALDDRYLYWDALRLLYRKISDIPKLRLHKNKGYSKLGALNACARALLLQLLRVTEEVSGINAYGLDELNYKGYTLRTILYELDAKEADRLIDEIDPNIDSKRKVSIKNVRDLSIYSSQINNIRNKLIDITKKEKSQILARKRQIDPIEILLSRL